LELSISKGIVLQHKGKIEVISNPQGTTFRIELPNMFLKTGEKE
jgi:signal transduction histidine kinase